MLVKSTISIAASCIVLLILVYGFELDARVLGIGFVTGCTLCLVRSLFDD